MKKNTRLLLFGILLFLGLLGIGTRLDILSVQAAETWASRDSFNLSGYGYYSKESEHFRMIWGYEDVNLGANGALVPVAKTDEFINGNLQNLESTREFFINELGLSDIGRPPSSPNGQKYKLNVYIAYTGLGSVAGIGDDWAYMSTDPGGYAYLVLDPDAMVVNPQSTVIPHELAHAFTHHMGGVTTWEWYEPVANFCRNEWFKSSYYKAGPDTDYVDTFLLNTEWRFPSVKKWYEIWPVLTYIYENPDNISGLGKQVVLDLLKDPRSDDKTYFHKIERVTGVPIEDILGGCERRLVTMDFEGQDLYLQDLNRLKSTNYNSLYTTLVDLGDGWLQVPNDRAPQQTGYNIIPLNVDLSQDVINVDFQGLNTSWNAGWRISIVTVTNSGDTRYSSMWSSGSNSMNLQGDETAAYLVVSATPADLEAIYVFNSDGSSNTSDTERFPYKVRITTDAAEKIEKKVLADFTFDDAKTGFSSENAYATGAYSLSAYNGGNALYLDGRDDFLEVKATDGSSLLTGVRELTISCMLKPETSPVNWLFYAAPNDDRQVMPGERYLGILDQNRKILAERFNNTDSRPATANFTRESDDWYYLTVTHTGSQTVIYVNGEEKARASSSYSLSGILGDSSILYIGKANWGNGEYYKGLIDDYTILNYAQSADEVKMSYAKATKPEVLADFTFDDAASGFTNGYGVATGTYTLQEHNGGKALYLDGISNFLEVKDVNGGSLLTGEYELTISFDAKPETSPLNWLFYAAPNTNTQVGPTERYLGILHQNATILAERFNNTTGRPATATASAQADKWYHLTVVHTQAETIIYIDGEEVARQTSTYDLRDILGANSILYIGKANWGNGEYYKGLIDNYKIIGRALTADEIKVESQRDKIVSSEEILTATYEGVAPVLPTEVICMTAGGEEVEKAVTWNLNGIEWSAFERILVTGEVEGGYIATATVEVIPENLVYFIDAGTGSGYLNGNTKSAVSNPYIAISGLAKLKNSKSDALYTVETGWGHVYDNTYLVSATVDGGDRPDEYTATDKYLTGIRDKSSGTQPMAYRFTLEAGEYELTVGYHEFYGDNRVRDMQPSIVWTDWRGEHVVEGNLIRLRSADQMAVISFTLSEKSMVEYRLTRVSGEAPMYSWIAVEQTGEYVPESLPFTDVAETAWYYDAVYNNYFANLMTGKTETLFAPKEALTRAQFALILYRMAGEPKVESDKKFDDVSENSWYTDGVLWAYEQGIITGYANTNNFGPHDNIMREQMAVMMYRYAKTKDPNVTADADFGRFADADKLGDYAEEAMKWAVGTGIITGKDEVTLDPRGNTIRAEAAVVIHRFVNTYTE